jgi:hypothetical protein
MSDEIKTVEATLVVKVQTWQDVQFRVQLVAEEDLESPAGRIWNVERASCPVGVDLVDSVGDLPEVILQGVGEEELDAIGERAASEPRRPMDTKTAVKVACAIVDVLRSASVPLTAGTIWASIEPHVALEDVRKSLGSLSEQGIVTFSFAEPGPRRQCAWELVS